jgi:hypothetical protein
LYRREFLNDLAPVIIGRAVKTYNGLNAALLAILLKLYQVRPEKSIEFFGKLEK